MTNLLILISLVMTLISCGSGEDDLVRNEDGGILSVVFDVSVEDASSGPYYISENDLKNITSVVDVNNIYKVLFEKGSFKLKPVSDIRDLRENFMIIRSDEETVLKVKLKDISRPVEVKVDKRKLLEEEDKSLFYSLKYSQTIHPWTKAKLYQKMFLKTKNIDNPYKKYVYSEHLAKFMRGDILFYNASCACTQSSCDGGKYSGVQFYEQYGIIIDLEENYKEVLNDFFGEMSTLVKERESTSQLVSKSSYDVFFTQVKSLYEGYAEVVSLLIQLHEISRLSTSYPLKFITPHAGPLFVFKSKSKLKDFGIILKKIKKLIEGSWGADTSKKMLSRIRVLLNKYVEYKNMKDIKSFEDRDLVIKDIFYTKTAKKLFESFDILNGWFSLDNKAMTRIGLNENISYNNSCN